jgi:hypothetical protein
MFCAPVLRGEDLALYEEMLRRLNLFLRPRDFIEELFTVSAGAKIPH